MMLKLVFNTRFKLGTLWAGIVMKSQEKNGQEKSGNLCENFKNVGKFGLNCFQSEFETFWEKTRKSG